MLTRLAMGVVIAAVFATAARAEERYFAIRVVDEDTGRGVPLVELRTVNGVCYYTDSNGLVAFDEPGLMGRRVFFFIESHGYEFPADGFGTRGAALTPLPGKSATLKIKRLNVAERLYRVTGAGIYRDSVLLGEKVPLREPVLNAQVFGSDSVMNAVYRGKIYWFWGDTNWPAYPLGNFHTPGAVSELPENGGLDPAEGVDLQYFVGENGFARPTAQMEGEGPTWISGVTVLRDEDGRERLFADYAKIRPPLSVYRRGMIEWNDEQARFEHVADIPAGAPLHSAGHTFQHEENGVRYVYFANPYPLMRVQATPKAFLDSSQYEAFTCLVDGSRLEQPQLDRDSDGRLRYAWRRNTPVVGPSEQKKLVEAGVMQPHEGLLQLRDRDTGRTVVAHGGSVYWNAHRRRWVMIAVEIGGESSFLGEVWLAEADTPVGPWAYAVKVVTHNQYSFYNPKQHPMFDQDGGRIIYFEGTYTYTFSGNPVATPRYDYNQVMYRLDLDDPRAALPVAIYGSPETPLSTWSTQPPAEFAWNKIAFFALDRPRNDAVPIYRIEGEHGERLVASPVDAVDAAPLFYALPADAAERPKTVAPLYEFVHPESGRRVYTTDLQWRKEGYQRVEEPLCYVWPNPT